MKNTISLEHNETLVAQWETKGKDWLALIRQAHHRFGQIYFYKGNGCSGSMVAACDTEAIAEMERGWGGNGKPGAAFVLLQDRPTLRRVFTLIRPNDSELQIALCQPIL